MIRDLTASHSEHDIIHVLAIIKVHYNSSVASDDTVVSVDVVEVVIVATSNPTIFLSLYKSSIVIPFNLSVCFNIRPSWVGSPCCSNAVHGFLNMLFWSTCQNPFVLGWLSSYVSSYNLMFSPTCFIGRGITERDIGDKVGTKSWSLLTRRYLNIPSFSNCCSVCFQSIFRKKESSKE